MNSSVRKYLLLGVALVAFAPLSFAQVNMTLTAVNPSEYAGTNPTVYTDPYFGTVGGVSSTIICDDYADDSYLNETWKANATTVSSVTSSTNTLKWIGKGISTQTLYDEIAYLSTQMLGTSSAEGQEAYSFALWELTCTYGTPNPAAGLGLSAGCAKDPFSTITSNSTLWNDANNDLNAALSQNYTPGEYSNVTIYTPINGTQNEPTIPQEFIVVPESSTIVMVSADLLGLLALAFFFRRRALQPLS